MKRKVLCIALALVMCLLAASPTFADSSAETPPDRATIGATFGLKKTTFMTHRMWANLINPSGVSVEARLTLYDSSYSPLYSISTTSSNLDIDLSKTVILPPTTYHLILSFTAEGSTHAYEKTYSI